MTHHEHDRPLEGRRPAIAVGPLYEEIEALYPLYRLREAGAEVEIIGSEAGATLPGKRGDEIEVERAAGDLSAGDLDLLVIAGGYGPEWEDAEVVVDGNLVSSRKPDDLPAFMRETIEVAAHAGSTSGAL